MGMEDGTSGRSVGPGRRAAEFLERRFLLGVGAVALLQAGIALGMGGLMLLGDAHFFGIFKDVKEFHEYSDRIFRGEVPYRDFLVEYPPLALAVFMPARLVGAGFKTFGVGLAAEMLLFNAGCVWLAARWTASREGFASVPRHLAWYTAFFMLCNPVALARFDLAVMACCFASACWLSTGRPRLGGAAASAAALLKLFPGVVAGPAFVRELIDVRSSRARGIIAAALVFALGVAAWLAIGGKDGVASSIRYHTERGTEIGSIYSGFLMIDARVNGRSLGANLDHAAVHLVSSAGGVIARLSPLLQLGGFLLALGASVRSGSHGGLRYPAACLLAFIVFGKVLSPQYLIWLIPFIACMEGATGRRARPVFLVACGLTLLVYPVLFEQVAALTVSGMVLLNLRNAALIALFGLLIFGRDAARSPLDRGGLEPKAPA